MNILIEYGHYFMKLYVVPKETFKKKAHYHSVQWESTGSGELLLYTFLIRINFLQAFFNTEQFV